MLCKQLPAWSKFKFCLLELSGIFSFSWIFSIHSWLNLQFWNLRFISINCYLNKAVLKKEKDETFLMEQLIGIHLPMQGTRVRFLVQEDYTCRGATKPPCSTTTEPELSGPKTTATKPNHPRASAPQQEAITARTPCTTRKSSSHSPQLKKAHAQQQRPSTAKINKMKRRWWNIFKTEPYSVEKTGDDGYINC